MYASISRVFFHMQLRQGDKVQCQLAQNWLTQRRVKISGDTDYINASLLQSESGEDPAWCYIAAQVGGALHACRTV